MYGICLGILFGLVAARNEPLLKSGASLAASKRVQETAFSLIAPFQESDNQNWEIGGAASVEGDLLRLTPPLHKKAGTLFSKAMNTWMTDWEINLEIDVRGKMQAGEGLALWYANKLMLGPVYGMSDYWQGLAIILDTFNDDGKGYTNHISAVYNDGTVSFNHGDDGQAQAFANCGVVARNLKDTFFLRMTYLNKKMTVDYASARSSDGKLEFRKCMEFENIELGMDSYFGVTASTKSLVEGPADSHDLLRVETYNLSPTQTTGKEHTAAVDKRRADFVKDSEAKHKAHQLSNPEFAHVVATSLHQMLGKLAVMDSNMLAVENMVEHNDRYNDNMFPQRLKFIGDDDGFQNDQIVTMVRAILDAQVQLSRDISHPNPQGSGEEALLITSAQARLTQDMHRVAENLQSLVQPSAEADISALQREGTNFIAQYQQSSRVLLDAISAFSTRLNDIQAQLDAAGSSGGVGWGFTSLLIILDLVFALLIFRLVSAPGGGLGLDSRYKDL